MRSTYGSVDNCGQIKFTDVGLHSSLYWLPLHFVGSCWLLSARSLVLQHIRFPRRLPFLQLERIWKLPAPVLDFYLVFVGTLFPQRSRYLSIYLANFCVSGVATQWYFYRKNNREQIKVYKPFVNLVRFHWGSVLGCALLTATLYVFDYILDFILVSILIIQNTDSSKEAGGNREYESLGKEKITYEHRGVVDFFNLCRS